MLTGSLGSQPCGFTTAADTTRHGRPLPHVCSCNSPPTPGSSRQQASSSQHQQQQRQRPQHAVLQRCHSLLVRQSASGTSGAAVTQQQPQQQQQHEQALTQQADQAPLQQQQQQQSWPPRLGLQSNQQQQRQQQEDDVSLLPSTSYSSSGSSSSRWRYQADASPASITWSIKHARSIDQLAAVVSLYAPSLNCIHVSAAFIQLQQLWPTTQQAAVPNNNSSSSSSLQRGDDSQQDDWLSSSSSGSSSSSDAADAAAAARRLLCQLQSLASTVSRIDSRFVSNVLYSLAVLHTTHGERAAYHAALVNRLCAAAYSLSNTMPPQELATVAWSLARLSAVPSPALLRRLMSNVVRQLPALGPQDLLMLLTALPDLHTRGPGVVAPYSTVHKLAAAAGAAMSAASPHEAAGMLAALGGLQWRAPPGWLSACYADVAPKLAHMGWEQLAMLCWGLGQVVAGSSSTHPISGGDAAGVDASSQQQPAPPAQWVDELQAAVMRQLQQEQLLQQQQGVPVVELCMVLYGWSKAIPQQPPAEPLQQLLFSVTQAAMLTPTTSSNLSRKQQRQQQQRRQPQQQQGNNKPLQAPQQQVQPLQQAATPPQQQQQVDQQQQPLPQHNSTTTTSAGLSPRLLSELVCAMARWQLLPPRQWLLTLLTNTQHHLLRTASSYSTRDLSSMLWGLASLGVRPKTSWLNAAAAAAAQQMQEQASAIERLQRQQRARQQQSTREWKQQQQQHHNPSQQQQQQPSFSLQQQMSQVQHSSMVERLGRESSQLLQQYQALPKQLAVVLWSCAQLQFTPAQPFWEAFWAASLPLLPRTYGVRELVLTLEAVVSHQQQPPQEWVSAALTAAASVHMRSAAGGRRSAAVGAGDAAAAAAAAAGAAGQLQPQQQQQQQYRRHVVRMLSAFARLGVSPGSRWCAVVVERVVQPLADQFTPQELGRVLCALGRLGYTPTGRALPHWLHQQVVALVVAGGDASSFSSSSSSTTSSSSSSSSVVVDGGGLFATGMSQSAAEATTVQLLEGLRRCRVVMSGRWLSQLLAVSEANAATLSPQVLAQLLSYVASTGVVPPTSWSAAVAAAVPVVLQAHTQQQQQQPLLHVWLRPLLSSLCALRMQLPPAVVAQLQVAVEQALQQGGGDSDVAADGVTNNSSSSSSSSSKAAKFMRKCVAALQKWSLRTPQQQQQQQQSSVQDIKQASSSSSSSSNGATSSSSDAGGRLLGPKVTLPATNGSSSSSSDSVDSISGGSSGSGGGGLHVEEGARP